MRTHGCILVLDVFRATPFSLAETKGKNRRHGLLLSSLRGPRCASAPPSTTQATRRRRSASHWRTTSAAWPNVGGRPPPPPGQPSPHPPPRFGRSKKKEVPTPTTKRIDAKLGCPFLEVPCDASDELGGSILQPNHEANQQAEKKEKQKKAKGMAGSDQVVCTRCKEGVPKMPLLGWEVEGGFLVSLLNLKGAFWFEMESG